MHVLSVSDVTSASWTCHTRAHVMFYLVAQMGFPLHIVHRCVLLCEFRTVNCVSRQSACCSAGTPTLGSRGTVVGVHEGAVEVLFDADFIGGGGDLYGRCRGQCGGMLAPADLLNLAKPHFSNITGAGQTPQHRHPKGP